MRYHILKNLAILLADSIWAYNWSFARYGVGIEISKKYISFHFRLIPRKTNDKIQKTVFRGHAAILAFFAQIWAKITFPGKKALSVFKYSNYLPSCQKSEKTDVIPEENAELTDGWTNRRKDRQKTMILQDPL